MSDVLGQQCAPHAGDTCAANRLVNEYYESIILMDAVIYDFWDRLQNNKDYKDNTIFMVLTVHGRHTHEFHAFGDKCEGCRHLFMLAIGPGIKKIMNPNGKGPSLMSVGQ